MAAFSRKRPELAEQFAANGEALSAELAVLDAELLALAEQLSGQHFIASHPIYQYLARRYQLRITELMWEPEMELGNKELNDLQRALAKQPTAQWMIWEGEPSADNRDLLKKRGLNGLVFAPVFNRPEQGDWLSAMRANIKQLQKAL